MIDFIVQNIGSIVIGAILFSVIALIIIKMISDRKSGKSGSCGCGCDSCAGSCGRH